VTYPWNDVNAYNAFLDEEERHLWEEKVRFALYGENARVRADVERKRAKEEGPDELADHEGLD
jgi:hypothetical protein